MHPINMCRGNYYTTKSCISGNLCTLIHSTNYSLYDLKKIFPKIQLLCHFSAVLRTIINCQKGSWSTIHPPLLTGLDLKLLLFINRRIFFKNLLVHYIWIIFTPQKVVFLAVSTFFCCPSTKHKHLLKVSLLRVN